MHEIQFTAVGYARSSAFRRWTLCFFLAQGITAGEPMASTALPGGLDAIGHHTWINGVFVLLLPVAVVVKKPPLL